MFGKADAVFAGDGAAPGDDVPEEVVEGSLAAAAGAGLLEVHHEVGMDVAVAGVAKAGDGETVTALEAGGQGEELFKAAAGHNDVFVELGQTGVAKGIGKLTSD